MSYTIEQMVEVASRWGPEVLQRTVRRGLLSAALRTVQEIVAREIPSRVPQPVDRGVYRAGWRANFDGTDVSVENNVPYASRIEFGLRAGEVELTQAFVEEILAWVERKQISGRGSSRAIAYRIARSIARIGAFNQGRGLGIMRAVVDDGRLVRFVEEEVSAEVERLLVGEGTA